MNQEDIKAWDSGYDEGWDDGMKDAFKMITAPVVLLFVGGLALAGLLSLL